MLRILILVSLMIPSLSYAKYKRIYSCKGEYSSEALTNSYLKERGIEYFRINLLFDDSKAKDKKFKLTYSETLTSSNTISTYTGLQKNTLSQEIEVYSFTKSTKDKSLVFAFAKSEQETFLNDMGFRGVVNLRSIYDQPGTMPEVKILLADQAVVCQEGAWSSN